MAHNLKHVGIKYKIKEYTIEKTKLNNESFKKII